MNVAQKSIRENATEIGEDSLTVMDFVYGEVIVNVTEDTQIVDSEGKAIKLSDIDTSMQLNVTYGETMTMSLPPMTTASKIEVTGELAKVIKEGSVSEVVAEEGTVTQIILGENEVALNVSDETIVKDAEGNVSCDVKAYDKDTVQKYIEEAVGKYGSLSKDMPDDRVADWEKLNELFRKVIGY